jgi:GntR family transcriptional regulator
MTSSTSLKLNANGALLHHQLFLVIRQQIESGRFRHGEKLPTQEELCRLFSVSRITVRRALADLQAQGLIRNEQGVGTFVTVDSKTSTGTKALGFVEELHRAYEETKMTLLSLRQERCPASIAVALRQPDKSDALHVMRTRSLGKTPVMLLDAWVPTEFASKISAKALEKKPLYHLISGGPNQLGKVIQQVNAALADPIVANALRIDVNAPTLKIERLMHNRENQPIQYMTIWSTPQRSRLVMEVSTNDLNSLNSGRLLHAL